MGSILPMERGTTSDP